MVKDTQEEPQEGQEQRLVGNGLLQVTVTVLIFKKWWVDYEKNPCHERMYFIDGIALDGIGTPFYVRAWFEIPLENLFRSEELDQIPMNSFLKLSSSRCSIEPAEDFNFDEAKPSEGSPQVVIAMKEPEYSLVAPEELGDRLKAQLLEANVWGCAWN